MRILFANHTSAWSGAEVALMRLANELRREHDVAVACPSGGPLADAVDAAHIPRLALPEVDVSMRLHPVATPRGLAKMSSGGLALARAASRFRADVIHANTMRVGLMASVAVRAGAPPVVLHTHDRLVLSPMGRTIRAVVLKSVSEVIAVSDFTARTFNAGLDHPVATRVYNSVDHERLDPTVVRPAPLRRDLGISEDALLLGQVAQITPWKGQATAIRAVAEVRAGNIDAHLLIVGGVAFTGMGVRYDNRAYLTELEDLVDQLEVRGAVHFLGQRDDVPEVMRALDLTLLPSEEEPFGLVTVESMALGTPPLVSNAGAGPELVEDGVTGRLLPFNEPKAWAAAVRELALDRPAMALMGRRGRDSAARFRGDVQAREVVAAYRRALGPVAPPVSSAPAVEELAARDVSRVTL